MTKIDRAKQMIGLIIHNYIKENRIQTASHKIAELYSLLDEIAKENKQ